MSNTTLEVGVRSNVEISVRVVAINSAGEGSPIVRVFSLNGKFLTIRHLHITCVCHFSCPRSTTHICFKCVFSKIVLGSTSIIHSRLYALPSEVWMRC